ncbi:hypothetical protein CFK37_18640 [Virgibacillus phasianinus]|uniref:C1q domain-containing protein n=1 Tax=Virgibacillus phasianinus TaxID=2017483 RepID=A0A220U7C4_9BACI|nr:hypothetical protein [Virgibacillus phasianinus]ASK64028.1 hypothetical protein CFK37_18640 [Virgibacillus phasianinus]
MLTNTITDFRGHIYIYNGNTAVAEDEEFHGSEDSTNAMILSVSSILQLQAGDQINVRVTSNNPTIINPNNPSRTHFEAARFLS